MNIVNVIVEYSDKNLSTYIKDAPIITTGKEMIYNLTIRSMQQLSSIIIVASLQRLHFVI